MSDANAPPPAILPATIRLCSETDGPRWDAYVASRPTGSFYHRYGWKAINEHSLGHETHFLIAERGADIVGVLPLVSVRSRLFGKILCSMPFVNYGGPCGDDAAVVTQLLDRARQIADGLTADYAEIRALEPLAVDLPATTHKVSMTIALQPDPDTLWNAFTSKHRTAVRRVYKNGLNVAHGRLDQLPAFYQVLARSWRQHGTPIYRQKYFADILTAFPEETRIFVVYRGSTPVAAAFNGYYRDTVEGMWAGTDGEFRDLQPSYVLYWEMIKHACENGYRQYHLGRSTIDSGGEAFKKKWNADSKQLYWHYYLPGNRPLPQLNVDNPRYRLAIQLWSRLPLGVTTMVGPYLARGIP